MEPADKAGDGDVARHLIGLETKLHRPDVRGSVQVAALLADEVVESGGSGRAYDKAHILAALEAEVAAQVTAF